MLHRAVRRSFARQVPIGMVGDVRDRRPVGRRDIFDAEVVLIIERIDRIDRHRAGIALVAVGADIAQRDRGGRPALDRGHFPQDLVETERTAVQRVRAIVDRRLPRLAVELEAPARQPVGEAADGRSEILGLVDIVGEIVIAERDIGLLAVAVGHHHRLQRRAERDDRCRNAVAVGQRHRGHAAPVRHLAKGRLRCLGTQSRRCRNQGGRGGSPSQFRHLLHSSNPYISASAGRGTPDRLRTTRRHAPRSHHRTPR